MLSLGYDIGSSSIKCAILDCDSGETVAQGIHPEEEMQIQSPQPGFAEQDPELWWKYLIHLTRKLVHEKAVDRGAIAAIGVSYQMHGLVLVNDRQQVLRPAIIWCDSRAVEIGRKAYEALGSGFCLQHLRNSPGNFTASKLRWVKENEPGIFNAVDKAMLPGDFIAMKLTGEISTTVSGLSEGVYWDFERNSISEELLEYYQLDKSLLPEVHPTFSVQGRLTEDAAAQLGLQAGTPVAYRAGDQPNNAFSLNVLHAGEVAATAGTSGVVYGVTDTIAYDVKSRVNPFAHVNHSGAAPRLGMLLCVNGTGILNAWLRKNVAAGLSYADINAMAAEAGVGAGGISVIPFGNGAERILENRNTGCQIAGLDFNRHERAHLLRAAHEGIAYSFKYGIDIMRGMGMEIRVIRAGRANMFLSPVFRQTLANVSGAAIELYETDGSHGAARGAAVGAGLFSEIRQAFTSLRKAEEVRPLDGDLEPTRAAYERWLSHLARVLS